MMTLLEHAAWHADGYVDGIVRDTRIDAEPDGLLRGAVVRMGEEEFGPVVALSIEPRRFPRKTPVHMHKSDTFRMALGNPLRVAGSTYQHGEFRLQRADTYYGPEYWTDEIGTNQLLLVADRRGIKPYLTDVTTQLLSDSALANDVSVTGIRMHERDADISQRITDNFGARMRGGYFDAGFTDTSAWPILPDGTRIAVIALGHPDTGPLVLCWDFPPSTAEVPAFELSADLLRLQVTGSSHIGDVEMPVLGFRLQRAGTVHASSTSGPDGSRELWVVADRRAWPPRVRDDASQWPGVEVDEQVRHVIVDAQRQPDEATG